MSSLPDGADRERALCDFESNLVIVAGAGTGKTRTLTYRVARLIEKGSPPESIVLATFTNRAAKEMIGRIMGF